MRVFENAIMLGYTKATVSAEVTDDGGGEVLLRGFVYGKSSGRQDTVFCGAGTGVFSAELKNLEPNTTYNYEAFARNAGGTGMSGKVTFTTMELGKPTVRTLEVTEESASTASCRGRVTDSGGSAVTVRGVCWSERPSPTINDSHAESGSGLDDYSCELTGCHRARRTMSGRMPPTAKARATGKS